MLAGWLAGAMLLLAWQEESALRDRSAFVLGYGNPFKGDQDLEALERYIGGLSVKEGAEARLLSSRMANEPTALFFFHPLDCFVCIRYMGEMLHMASDESQDSGGINVEVLAYDSNQTELKSLAHGWGDDGENWFLLHDAHLVWPTPFVVVLDAGGNAVFANTIVNSSERQEIVMQAYSHKLNWIAESRGML